MGTLGYVGFSSLVSGNRYYRDFAELFYGTNGTLPTAGTTQLQNDIESSYMTINDELRSTGRFSVLPYQKDRDGLYPQSLIDWNAYLTIYTKLISDFMQDSDDVPSSISIFGSFVDKYSRIVKEGGVLFNEEIDVGELGIGQPQIASVLGTDSRGTFFNNWRGFPFGDYVSNSGDTFGRGNGRGYVNGFTGSDFPRLWTLNVITQGGIGTAEYTWSMDSGMNIEGTLTASGDWLQLQDNVWVRFAPDDSGSNYFSLNDKWKFQTVPLKEKRVYGSREVRLGRAVRGF